MSQPIYIFDLDGTLALIDHRRHFLDNKDDPYRWDRFYNACDLDLPNNPVISTMHRLHHIGSDIRIFSGRSAIVRQKTIRWLVNHTNFMVSHIERILKMRDEADYTPDEILKIGWLNEMSSGERDKIVAVFDDRAKVVKAWRENGVACFQVADGEF